MQKKKVFVIGLDGGTFNIINPLVKEGKLPNIARIMREGSSAYLDSTLPPVTPVAWPSMFTGKLPGKHGVFDFEHPLDKYDPQKNRAQKQGVNSTFIKAKTLWELLGEAGKKSIVIDVPLTYPPSKIAGLMISRIFAAKKMKAIYPESLYAKLTRKKLLRTKKGGNDLLAQHRDLDEKQKKRLVKSARFGDLLAEIGDKLKLVRYLSQKDEWDFFMVVFMESDYIGHGFWKYKKRVKKLYQRLDKAIGEILAFLPDESLKMIVSDHGFKTVRAVFFLDEWLFRQGYAKKTFNLDAKARKLFEKRSRYKENIRKKPGRHVGVIEFRAVIDQKKSLAYLYSGVSYGLRINLKGRDPWGIVEPEDYERLRAQLIRKLKKLKDPANGKLVFEKVLKREEVIGSMDDNYNACDIYVLPRNMDYALNSVGGRGNQAPLFKRYRRGRMGFHRKEGIFFALGDEFKKGFDAGRLSILDVTPTILHLMRLEVPGDVDGKVRKEIFHKKADSYKRKIRFGRSSQKIAKQERFSGREEEEIKQRLRALGYVE